MCCNAYSTAKSDKETASVQFNDTLVATPLPDGYWLHAFPFHTDSVVPDLVGFGLGFQDKPASIKLLINPKNGGSSDWKLNEIQRLDFPVSMSYADLTGDGSNDIIICDRYGPGMDDLWDANTKNGGRLLWLRNPGGRDIQPLWSEHVIGNSTGMHRYVDTVGKFSQTTLIQVMGLPILSKAGDRTSPAPVIVYTPIYGSDASHGPKSWSAVNAFPSQFRIIHDAKLLPGTNGGLDMVLVAGREGIALLWFDSARHQWKHHIVGTGLPKEQDNPLWGSGTVDVVRVGDDSVGYVATGEALHGNTVAVYTKPANSTKGAASLKEKIWTRHVVDNFGPLDTASHTGTIHHVHAVRNAAGASGSFGVACMGARTSRSHFCTDGGAVLIVMISSLSPENQGVYVYTPTDLLKGVFKKSKISGESAATLAVAPFSDPSKEEVASISYYVPGYHTGPDPPSVRLSSFASHTEISATKLNKEVLLRVPRPERVPEGVVPSIPFLTIAGKKLTLVVLRPGQVAKLQPAAGAKVIYGSIEMHVRADKKVITRGIAPGPKTTATTLHSSVDGRIKSGKYGAVFILVEAIDGLSQGPYQTMDEITTTNLLRQVSHVPANVKAMEFPFIKVEDLEWGDKEGAVLWNGFEFYNMTGYHIYFDDDAMAEICHMQAWTLGLGETARFHNHADKSFCEIHYCLSNGGGGGSMRYFDDDYADNIDTEKELTKDYVEAHSTVLVVPTMFEHGPLWKIAPGTKWTPELRENDTADYPWHAWLASQFGTHPIPIVPPITPEEQKFDLWLAFEFPTSAFQA
ncbi:hypothetical protein C8R43DRAFT_1057751 [Mycena crocata]|nr:hypothetical protein C8R43DRAFT_1057751 [Mycena crocata]